MKCEECIHEPMGRISTGYQKNARGLFIAGLAAILLSLSVVDGASLDLLGQEIVKAGSSDLAVTGHSVPIVADWNNDGRKDIIVSEQPTSSSGKIRVYLNIDSDSNPNFNSYFYVQSNGSDLTVPASGCLGAAPCIVYWNSAGRKDLLVGRADGYIIIYHNINTDASPTFDGGTTVQFGPAGNKVSINVGMRAIPTWVDWNNDGKKDLVVGAYDGKLRLYLNTGTNSAPEFLTENFINCGGTNLTVPSGRSAPAICDFDGDGKKDIIAGNTNGQLLFYRNTGSDADPYFTGYTLLKSTGAAIGLLPGGDRTRPFICDWDDDGLPDILVGYGDGKVHLFCGTFFGDLDYNKMVDMQDFAIFSQQWLTASNLAADIAPVGGDGVVNAIDLAVLIQNWLSGIEP